MVKIFNKVTIFFIVLIILFSSIVVNVNADTIPSQTKVSEYAMSWNNNKNIPYVFGSEPAGKRGRSLKTLEEVEKKNKEGSTVYGIDCSAFTSRVYRHFGVEIPEQSSAQKNAAIKTFKDINQAVPGDVVWWQGHVAIYVGNDKIVHTNTSNPSKKNYPHVESVWYSSKGKPTFCRMVEDVSVLQPMSGSDASTLNDLINNTERSGTVVTESDLTGMPLDWSLGDNFVELPNGEELSETEKVSLEAIQEDVKGNKMENFNLLFTLVSFLGVLSIMYGILLGVAYLFDRANNFVEISLLSIITLGRYRLYDEQRGVSAGFNRSENKLYCNASIIIKRIIIIELIGFFLVSGIVYDCIYNAFSHIADWLGIF